MNNLPEIEVSPGAILLLSGLIFFDRDGLLSALVPAVIAHELGHILAIAMTRGRISLLSFSSAGLRMDYLAPVDASSEIIMCMLGPVMGLIYAFAASNVGAVINSEYLLCSGGLSLVLSLYNLLPALPLDGGRILKIVLEQLADFKAAKAVMFILSLLTGLALSVAGVFYLARGYGYALIPAGLWIMALSAKEV